jgi:hypothetical protein
MIIACNAAPARCSVAAIVASDVQRDDWWSDFNLRNPLPITIEAVWEQEFERVPKRLPEPKGLLFATPIIRPSINAGAWKRDELNRLRTLSDERRNDKLLLEAQHRLLISNSAAKPRGLWSGAVVLAILTVTTVVIPILYLTPSAQRGPLSAPMITGIFFAGIAVLLAYVGFEVVRITRAKP